MSSPSDRSVRAKLLLARLWAKRRAIAWLFYILGLVSFALLPLAAQKIYMDEKALLVGSTAVTSASAGTAAAALASELSRTLPHPTSLVSLIHAASAKFPTQVWHTEYYVNNKNNNNNNNNNKNCSAVYTVVPGKRSDGTEALLLAMPIDYKTSSTATLAVSIGIHAAGHLTAAPWLAKDVAVVFLDTAACTSLETLENWLESSGGPHWVDRRPALGLLQQGLVLDVASSVPIEARLGVHGYSGQLPNLDMVAMTKRNSDYYTTLPVGLDVGGAPAARAVADTPQLRVDARTAAVFAANLAAGRPTGAHAALLRRGIDALTVTFAGSSLTSKSSPSSQASLELTARRALATAEMVLRSCNNLQERLHRASALYLLVGAERFVNIGAYIVPPALLLASLLLFACDAFISFLRNTASFQKSEWKKGLTRALVVHALIAAAAAVTTEFEFKLEEETLLILRAAAVVVGLTASLWKYSTFWMSDGKNKSKQGNCSSTEIFVAASLALLAVEAAALLLLRWALCYALLAVALPLHQLAVYYMQ